MGVFYAREDHLGLLRRCGIQLLDLAPVSAFWGLSSGMVSALGGPPAVARGLFAVLAWGYLAVLKVSPLRTLGYRVCDAKLVDLHGQRASLWRATLRFLLLAINPATFIIDVLWLTGEPNRQTLRDKLAGTYVVRSRAVPIGASRIRYPTYFVSGLSVVLPEVPREAEGEPP